MYVFLLWIKEFGKGVIRNFGWTLMAVFLSVACLLSFALSYVSGMNAKYFANKLEEKIEINVDLKETETDYTSIRNRLEGLKDVKEVGFVSKEEAYTKTKERLGKNSDLLTALDVNPFPARFVVKLEKADRVEQIADTITGWKIAESVEYGESFVKKMMYLTEFTRNAGVVFTIIASIFSVLVLMSTIRINIVQRKQEIRVKQVVGASYFTIRFPFILEAMFITFLSAGIVYLLIYFGYEKIVDVIQSAIPYGEFVSISAIGKELILPLALMAFGIALVGSTFSVKRFLKRT